MSNFKTPLYDRGCSGKSCYSILNNEERQKWREEIRLIQKRTPIPNLEEKILGGNYSDFRSFINSSFSLDRSTYTSKYWTSVINKYSTL